MIQIKNMSFRVKMVLVISLMILAVSLGITITLTLTASQQAMADKQAHLNLLTEQVLIHFSNSATAAADQLISQTASKGVIDRMDAMRNLSSEDPGYFQHTQGLVYAINQMLTAQTYYDAIYVRLNSGPSFSNSFADGVFLDEASATLDAPEHQANTYGRTRWLRSPSGQVYILRDVYDTMPIRHLGRMVARIRQPMLSSLGSYNSSLNCVVCFLDGAGKPLTMVGSQDDALFASAVEAVSQGKSSIMANEPYTLCVKSADDWMAVGMLPSAALDSVNQAVIRTGFFVAVLGILFGALAAMAVTHRLTRQMRTLVKSMDEVSVGNLDLTVPIEGNDEIGQLSSHFNRMLQQTRELLERVVQEEARKSKAEYDMLEYQYRSLQSQINPHFIYNAMETVNALAKLDGNDEICEVVQHISAFFRQNTGNMRRRFITVRREFDSLKQYAYIYCHIHGDSLSTPFTCTLEAEDALIPTMILQPVLENALVHGIRPAGDKAVVAISASDENESVLHITVRDNGGGMPAATVAQILNGPADEPLSGNRSSTGIGMRNVRDRLRLIYGDAACLSIQSGADGTLVTISIPLIYDERELPHYEAV